MCTPFIFWHLSICSINRMKFTHTQTQKMMCSRSTPKREQECTGKTTETDKKTNAPLVYQQQNHRQHHQRTGGQKSVGSTWMSVILCEVYHIRRIAMRIYRSIVMNLLCSSGTQAKFHNNWLKGTVGSTEIRAQPWHPDTERFQVKCVVHIKWPAKRTHSGSWKRIAQESGLDCDHLNPYTETWQIVLCTNVP